MIVSLVFDLILILSHFLSSLFSHSPQPSPSIDLTSGLVYGYVTTNETASGNIFWWFRQASEKRRRRRVVESEEGSGDDIPLLIFLQGGPGASDWFGELCEFGPVKLDCFSSSRGAQGIESTVGRRESSWSDLGHILLVDSPLGAGFSYVLDPGGYAHTDEEVSRQLLVVVKSVLEGELSWLIGSRLWIIGESYGGKIAAHFAKDVLKSQVDLHLAGVGLIDTWISPQACVDSYGTFLKATSQIDSQQKDELDAMADEIRSLTLRGQLEEAGTKLYYEQLQYVDDSQVNMYDVSLHRRYDHAELTSFMNDVVKPSLQIVPSWLVWQNINATTRSHMRSAFVTNATEQVRFLLYSGVKIAILQGQLDVCVNVLCTLDWVENDLRGWIGLEEWKQSVREKVFAMDDELVAFRKRAGLLDFWWILDAGHMVPGNRPASVHQAMEAILS